MGSARKIKDSIKLDYEDLPAVPIGSARSELEYHLLRLRGVTMVSWNDEAKYLIIYTRGTLAQIDQIATACGSCIRKGLLV